MCWNCVQQVRSQDEGVSCTQQWPEVISVLYEETEALRQQFNSLHTVIHTFRRCFARAVYAVNDIPISRAEGGQGLWKIPDLQLKMYVSTCLHLSSLLTGSPLAKFKYIPHVRSCRAEYMFKQVQNMKFIGLFLCLLIQQHHKHYDNVMQKLQK